MATVAKRVEPWNAFWCRGAPEQAEEAAEAVRRAAVAVRCEHWAPLTSIRLRGALCSFKPLRSAGADFWQPMHLLFLPDEALGDLGKVYAHIEERLAPPGVFLCNVVVLVPKPAGVDRAIGLTSLIYFLWVNARGLERHE